MYSMLKGKPFSSNTANPYFWIQVSRDFIDAPAASSESSPPFWIEEALGGAEEEKRCAER